MTILQGGRQNTILPNFPKNYMKWKKFGSGEEGAIPRGPLRSATVCVMKHLKGDYEIQGYKNCNIRYGMFKESSTS